ncbi:NAD(P)-binding domain-containing protein [Escherichia coli]
MDKGYIIIDGGNTFFQDTIRRNRELSAEGFNFIGTWRVRRLRRGRSRSFRSCLAARKKLMNWLLQFSSRLLLSLKTVSRA